MSGNYLNKINKSKPVRSVIKFSQRIILPGFEGIPLYAVLVFFFKGLYKGSITTRASSLAFNFFLAVFPSIIFLFTLIPFVPIDNFQIVLFELLRQLMPQSAFEAAEGTIVDILKNQHGGLLSIGFISALYFSTNGFNAMIEGFNNTFHQIESRTAFRQRIIALVLVLITTILVIVAIALIIYSEFVLAKIPLEKASYYSLLIGRYLIVVLLFFTIISFIYYLGPVRKKGWRFLSAGSTFATILILLTSLGFAYYVNNFGTYNKLYGSIGTLIIVLLWIYFNSIVLLLGFELNASIHSAKRDSVIHPVL